MKEKIMKSRYFVPSCYLLFSVIIFFLSFYLTLPVETIRQRIITEIETQTPLRAEIKQVDVSPIFSLKIHNLMLYRAEKQLIQIDELKIRPSIFTVFSSSLNLPFSARLLGGETTGTLVYGKKTRQIEKADVKITGVNLVEITSLIPADLGNKSPLFQGFLEGSFSIALGAEPKGEFGFDINNLGVKNLRLKGLLLPEFNNLESSLRGKIENEMTKIDDLKLEGEGLNLVVAGTMPLFWKMKRGGVVDLG
ncbi:MAG: type II secretion system protein GspN, partial [Thermodesulfobacteriota bacterium]